MKTRPGAGNSKPRAQGSRQGPELPNLPAAAHSVIQDAVAEAGLFLDGAKLARDGARLVVRVVVDLPEEQLGSVAAHSLSEVSRGISRALDRIDYAPPGPTGRGTPAGGYLLEVTTPGLARPLTEPRHFRRARTRMIDVLLVDRTKHRGRLVEVTADGELGFDDGTRIPLSQVRRGKVVVELNRLAEAVFNDVEDSDDED